MNKNVDESRRDLLRMGGVGGVAAGIATLTPNLHAASSPNVRAVLTNNSAYFNVLDFGAVGDGVADDGIAIQRAIDAASLLEGSESEKNLKGGVVYLPAGIYLVDEIRLRRNITLMGEGMGTIVTQKDDTNTAVITNYSDLDYPVVITNLRIQGTKNPSDTGDSARGIVLRSTSAFGGFTVPDGQHIIDQVWIEHTHADGIYVKRDCRGTLIKDCWIADSATKSGIWLDGSDSTIVNTVSRGHKNIADKGEGGTGYKITSGNNRLLNCKAFFCRGGGFYYTGSRGNLSACEAQDNWFDGFRFTGNDTIVTGCLADSNQNAGIHIDPDGGFIAGMCFTGFNSFGRNVVQAAKPWVGQDVGLRISEGNLNDSYFAGIVRNNNIEQFQQQAEANTETQFNNIVIG